MAQLASIFYSLLGFLFLALMAGCDTGPKSAHGFTLPDGDAERGKAAFTQLRCYDCHTVAEVELPAAEEMGEKAVRLGGKVPKIKTYGELVTAIINPSHRLAKGYAASDVATAEGASLMKNYNDAMTVSQLIDVVAFLQSHYDMIIYEPTRYPPYY